MRSNRGCRGPLLHACLSILNSVESSLAEHLNADAVDISATDARLVSEIGNPEYRVKLTLESKRSDYLERAFRHLLELIPGDAVGESGK